ncbi:hypothetical protein Hanom_Chr16g01481131 [Helianthus anomalus]
MSTYNDIIHKIWTQSFSRCKKQFLSQLIYQHQIQICFYISNIGISSLAGLLPFSPLNRPQISRPKSRRHHAFSHRFRCNHQQNPLLRRQATASRSHT